MMFEILFYIIIIYIILITYFHLKYPELRWNWNDISIGKIFFPSSFIWGTATASHQVEGNCINNWSEFEQGSKKDGQPNIRNDQRSGIACDHWNQYPEDIKLIKELGVSHYRFSVEWSKIQPSQDTFDQDVLNHYSEMIDTLINNNITPVLTLYHFTHPLWFEKLGAFERKENIDLFIYFCQRVFNEYSTKVKFWCTINEPAVVATQGYFTGMFPPGEKKPQLTAEVLKNLLDAHVQVYHSLKKLKNGLNTQIGLVKNINQFDPWRRWHILDWMISIITNYFYNNSTIVFLRTGLFKIRIPGLIWINHENPNAIHATDYFGLNYYSHNHLQVKFSLVEPFTMKFRDNDILTDMPYTIYGEGLYRAIQSVSILDVPIIITENGIADEKDDRRELYIKRYLYALSKSIKDGYNVIGYFYWSLMDNFEWAFGYDMKFGLFSVNFETQERSMRKSSKTYIDVVNNN